jgi:suppressor of fused
VAEPDQEGPGLTALKAHVDRIDGGPPSDQFFPRNPRRFQRGGPLHAVTVHALDDPRHWHLVTYGLSELFEKESPDKGVSGWGFELTFRLARSGDNDGEAEWASDLLTNLAAYVWESGHDFAHGDHVDLRGPIKLDAKTAITAAAMITDPTLATVRGPFGRVEFLQVVGLTADELELCRAWRTDAVLDLLTGTNPLGVTDLDRPSMLDDPAIRERAEAGIGADGSSLEELRVGTLRLIEHGRRTRRVALQMGAGAAAGLGPALRRKLNRPGATFRMVGGPVSVTFVVTEPARWQRSGQGVTVDVPLAEVDQLAGLFTGKPGSGELPGLRGLRFVVLA